MNLERVNGNYQELLKTQAVEFDGDPRVATQVIQILNSPLNRPHFANPYQSVEEMQEVANDNKRHILTHEVGGKVVATATIDDAAAPVNGHYLNAFSVSEDLQGNGVGREFMEHVKTWAFNNETYESRERKSLRIGIAMGIDGWEKMYKLAKSTGFTVVGVLSNQMEIESGDVDVMLMTVHHDKK